MRPDAQAVLVSQACTACWPWRHCLACDTISALLQKYDSMNNKAWQAGKQEELGHTGVELAEFQPHMAMHKEQLTVLIWTASACLKGENAPLLTRSEGGSKGCSSLAREVMVGGPPRSSRVLVAAAG